MRDTTNFIGLLDKRLTRKKDTNFIGQALIFQNTAAAEDLKTFWNIALWFVKKWREYNFFWWMLATYVTTVRYIYLGGHLLSLIFVKKLQKKSYCCILFIDTSSSQIAIFLFFFIFKFFHCKTPKPHKSDIQQKIYWLHKLKPLFDYTN